VGDCEDIAAIEVCHAIIETCIELVRRCAELAEIERLRPRVRRQQGVAIVKASLRADLDRIVIAAGAIAFVEDRIGQSECREQRAA
jgi:hypothetical protein